MQKRQAVIAPQISHVLVIDLLSLVYKKGVGAVL